MARSGSRHAVRHGTARIGAYLAWAAALVRFGALTGRGTATPVEDLLTRDGLMVACELACLALFVAGL